MRLPFAPLISAIALWLAIGLGARVAAAPVAFDSVITTFHSGTDEDLRQAIDGEDVGLKGWFVAPHTDEPQAVVFRAKTPVETEAMDITLCFLSGRPNSYFGEFTVSVTSDPHPSLDSQWNLITPVRYSSTGPELSLLENGHLLAEKSANDAVFQLAVRVGQTPVTGFRVDAFPSKTLRGVDAKQLAGSHDGDFMLTEFRVEAATPRTTNIARGKPVKASHALWGKFTADYLTDGLPGTFAHPRQAGLGSSFYFEIDLGAVRQIDHIGLRNRGDGTLPERMSRVTIDLYDQPPDSGAKPVWEGRYRDDGSHSGVGEVDVERASDGKGKFAGRWMRLSSDSRVAFSPQFAEVEVYDELGPQLAWAKADGSPLPIAKPLRTAPGARWLVFGMKLGRSDVPDDLAWRWRLRGYHADWQTASGMMVETLCPPPGRYTFEAQVRHTDREWDAAVLAVPIEVRGHFWQARSFRVSLAALGLLAVAAAVRAITRRRIARRMAALESKATLDEERARIARDMHDEVGARLSQLAILQDIFAREHALPDSARENMRQLAQTARQAVASLDEVVWAVNPKNDTLPSLAAYLEQCATDYLGSVDIACRLDAPFEWPEIEIRAQVRHNLVLAFREALQNVLKHSGASEATLTLRQEASRFVILLADNGRGLSHPAGATGGDGLGNMNARLASIGGSCEIRSRAGGGVEVEMRAPLAQDGSLFTP